MTPALARSLVLPLAASLLAQGTPAPAPTAPHIEWQRTVEDALAEQERTGLPLLLVFNTKGEVFNDRFRDVVYARREFVESTRGYVCLVGSPDRHTERDHDVLGNRVECPAFPGCTCSEHRAIMSELFSRWFGDNRWAPHHKGIDANGKVLFDRFGDNRMEAAIDAIAAHRGTPRPLSLPAGLPALLQRRDAAARRAVEGMYRRGALAERERILQAAAKATTRPHDLLRMALASRDDREFDAGAAAGAQLVTAAELPLLEDALARTQRHRKLLLDALARIGKTDEAAARLHAHLTGEAPPLPAPWGREWQPPAYDVTSLTAIEKELDRCEPAVRERPDDHTMRLRLAIAQLAFAEASIASGNSGVEFWIEMARESAVKVEDDALKPEAQAVVAVASWLAGDPQAAQLAARSAQSGEPGDRRPNGWLAARLLEVDVQTTVQLAYAKAADPAAVLQPEVARVLATLRRLAQTPWLGEKPALTGIGLLEYAGLRAAARELLDVAVRRFPTSPALHERWRNRVMADLGTEAMHEQATALVARADDQAAAEWFAGYAGLIAAEQHVRDERRELAVAAYSDAIARYARSAELNPAYADTANHFAVLALAGRALERHEAGKHGAAVADLVKARELREASLHEQDGLKRTPRGIASRIQKALVEKGQTELAARLEGIAL